MLDVQASDSWTGTLVAHSQPQDGVVAPPEREALSRLRGGGDPRLEPLAPADREISGKVSVDEETKFGIRDSFRHRSLHQAQSGTPALAGGETGGEGLPRDGHRLRHLHRFERQHPGGLGIGEILDRDEQQGGALQRR